jgi:hypothetical protein
MCPHLESEAIVTPVVDDRHERVGVALDVSPVAPQVAPVVDERPERLGRFVASIDVPIGVLQPRTNVM